MCPNSANATMRVASRTSGRVAANLPCAVWQGESTAVRHCRAWQGGGEFLRSPCSMTLCCGEERGAAGQPPLQLHSMHSNV